MTNTSSAATYGLGRGQAHAAVGASATAGVDLLLGGEMSFGAALQALLSTETVSEGAPDVGSLVVSTEGGGGLASDPAVALAAPSLEASAGSGHDEQAVLTTSADGTKDAHALSWLAASIAAHVNPLAHGPESQHPSTPSDGMQRVSTEVHRALALGGRQTSIPEPLVVATHSATTEAQTQASVGTALLAARDRLTSEAVERPVLAHDGASKRHDTNDATALEALPMPLDASGIIAPAVTPTPVGTQSATVSAAGAGTRVDERHHSLPSLITESAAFTLTQPSISTPSPDAAASRQALADRRDDRTADARMPLEQGATLGTILSAGGDVAEVSVAIAPEGPAAVASSQGPFLDRALVGAALRLRDASFNPDPALPTYAVAEAVTSDGFAQAVGARITMMVREGVQEARLHLHPVELGPVTVKISVDGDAARIDFLAQASMTRQTLESSMPSLAASLRDAGLTLTGGGVHPQASHQQASHQHGQPDRSQLRDQAGSSSSSMGDDRASQMSTAAPRVTRVTRGLVDLVA